MSRDRSILLPGSPPDKKQPAKPAVGDPSIDLDDQLPLAAPTMWTRGFLILCGVVTAVLYLLLREASQLLETSLGWETWLVPLGILIVILIVRRLLLPPQARTIRFGADTVELPKGRNSRRTATVAYEDIRTIVPLVSRGQPALVIDGSSGTQVYIASDFPHAELWRVLWAQLTDRIGRRPKGRDQLIRMRQMAELSQQTTSVKGRFTKRLFWVIAAIFAAQVMLGPPVDILEFLYFGANSRVMVLEEYQIWRVVTANLLHGNGIHFAVNAFALYFLGTYCERLLGEGRTVVLTFGTALAGATASLLGTAALFSVGISTALFGLLGAYFALHLRFGKQLPPPYRQSRRWWVVILGLNAVLSVAVPIIDAWGHFGGFVAGLGLAWLMTRGQKTFQPRHPSGGLTNMVAAGLLGLFVISSFVAIGYAVGDHPDDEVTIARALLERVDEEDPALLAQVSRQWSRHSPRPAEVDPILVALADAAFKRSDDIFIQWRTATTIITLAEEMGETTNQQVMKRGVVRFEEMASQHDDAEARSVLARILVEYYDQAGALIDADIPFREASIVDDAIAMEPDATLDLPRRVYLLAIDEDDDRSDALLRRCLRAGEYSAAEPAALDRPPRTQWRLEVVMSVAVSDCSDAAHERWHTTTIERHDDS